MSETTYTHSQLKEVALAEVHCEYNDCFILAITQDWDGNTKVKIDNDSIMISVAYLDSVATAEITRDPLTFKFTTTNPEGKDGGDQIGCFFRKFIFEYMLSASAKFSWGFGFGSFDEICYDRANAEINPGTDLTLWCDDVYIYDEEQTE